MAVTETATEVEPVQPAEQEPSSLFGYSMWIHVGAGAEECDEVDEREGTNRCGDSGHFHAWCRLPNQFQIREIREHALAAKARKQRQLRSDGTDAYEILENDLQTLLAEPDAGERMANELVGYDWTTDYLTAVHQVRELADEGEEAEDDAKLYAHVDDDRRRLLELQGQPEDERPADEYTELQQQIASYEKQVDEHYQALRNPKLESYQLMAEDELATLVRRKRIEMRAHEEFMHHYSINEWLSCTFRDETGGQHAFADLDALQDASEQVLAKLHETFADLERTAQEAQGN
jgi:hypothetical protein